MDAPDQSLRDLDSMLEQMTRGNNAPIPQHGNNAPIPQHGNEARVHPNEFIAPCKKVDGFWTETDKWAPASITAVVRVQNDPNNVFILTCGHAFFDADPNRSIKGAPNSLDVFWGEFNMAIVQNKGPHSESWGPYYMMGDKLDSKVDCGLALVEIHSPQVSWSNLFHVPGLGDHSLNPRNLIALDDDWAIKNDVVYQVQDLIIPYTEFIACNSFEGNFLNWQGGFHATLEHVWLRVRPKGNSKGEAWLNNGTSLTKGASGSALIRHLPDSNNAVVVALYLGICQAYATPTAGLPNGIVTDIFYEVFQHVSVAKVKLGLSADLPQPPPKHN